MEDMRRDEKSTFKERDGLRHIANSLKGLGDMRRGGKRKEERERKVKDNQDNDIFCKSRKD